MHAYHVNTMLFLREVVWQAMRGLAEFSGLTVAMLLSHILNAYQGFLCEVMWQALRGLSRLPGYQAPLLVCFSFQGASPRCVGRGASHI